MYSDQFMSFLKEAHMNDDINCMFVANNFLHDYNEEICSLPNNIIYDVTDEIIESFSSYDQIKHYFDKKITEDFGVLVIDFALSLIIEPTFDSFHNDDIVNYYSN
ncbi:hypothetical protein [Paramagnetospirillum marisnigri]|uniref:hypothetical protein n=1 Tax=Paramagnetospirillum marisnigri TaxID=1285242 RepID=UPI000A56EF94|nr:hypothetical protein [Paramagnetospirillum marisnigri]